MVDPQKRGIFEFWNKNRKKMFFIFFFYFSFKNNRRTHVIWSVFLFVFKNTDKKNICVSIIIKAESKPKPKEIFCLEVFFKNQKPTFFGVQNGTFYCQISNLYFCVCSLMYSKRKLRANFYKEILIFGPPGIFSKWKL